jgi:hypothetical protein
VRVKSPGGDSRLPWVQEPDAGSSGLSELVQGVSELEVGRDYRFVVGARVQIFIPENAAYHR